MRSGRHYLSSSLTTSAIVNKMGSSDTGVQVAQALIAAEYHIASLASLIDCITNLFKRGVCEVQALHRRAYLAVL
jgi:hypothetical protein